MPAFRYIKFSRKHFLNNSLKISVLPTLLISSMGVINNVENTTTMDLKLSGDLIYIIGETKDECGGSEYYSAFNEIGAKSPKVDAINSRILYEKIYTLHQTGILNSCASVCGGGILITLAKMSIAGRKGVVIKFLGHMVSPLPGGDPLHDSGL